MYVRSHYDGMTLVLPDAPMPDEIAVIFCLANRGRLGARVGGLTHEEVATRERRQDGTADAMKTAIVNLGEHSDRRHGASRLPPAT